MTLFLDIDLLVHLSANLLHPLKQRWGGSCLQPCFCYRWRTEWLLRLSCVLGQEAGRVGKRGGKDRAVRLRDTWWWLQQGDGAHQFGPCPHVGTQDNDLGQ
uniref:Uncharacterized protein n=1 Tax=Pavo cristatus TaxID=9049 RepID=A0A8C9G6S8_PAVCR